MRRVDADNLIVRLQALYVSAVCIGGDSENGKYILKAIEEVAKAPTISDEELAWEANMNYNKGYDAGFKQAISEVKDKMKELGIGGEDDEQV